jgi:hypothetical protein
VLLLIAVALAVVAVLRPFRAHPGRPLRGSERAPHGQSVITSWLPNAEPAGWDARTNRVIINRRGPDGLWDAYSVRPDGRGRKCLTCARPSFPGVGTATNRGASDVSPDGRYVLLVVEQGHHTGRIGSAQTEPGRGVDNNLWLCTADGRRAWRLTDLPGTPDSGVNWPRFDRTGSEIVWSQLYGAAGLGHPLGEWVMRTSQLRWRHGAPYLADIRSYDPEPGHYYEPYGFSPGDSRILFASDIHVPHDLLSPSAFNAQIWTISAAGLDDLRRVSPEDRLHGAFSDYNEFAYYIPDSRRILLSRTEGNANHGLDYWTVNRNGSDPRRLTFMNDPGTRQFLGYTVGGGVAFDPRDPRRFVAGVSHDLGTVHLQAIYVTIGDRTR